MSIKSICLAILFILFINSCQTKSTETTEVKNYSLVEKKDTIIDNKFTFLLGTWIVDKEFCDESISLSISKKNGRYAYVFRIGTTSDEGFLEIKDEDGIYVVLPEIKWAEYRGTIPKDKDPKDIPLQDASGIDFQYDSENGTLMFQNIGNSMNYYIKFDQIECRYVILKK